MIAKALETSWSGYRFRSRIEARWAVFLTTAGIGFQYEPEGFDLDDGIFYLPDFLITTPDCWVEVKGAPPDDEARAKMIKLVRATERPGYIFFGDCWYPPHDSHNPTGPAEAFLPDERWLPGWCWTHCQSCRALAVGDHTQPCSCGGQPQIRSTHLVEAFAAARAERFDAKPPRRRQQGTHRERHSVCPGGGQAHLTSLARRVASSPTIPNLRRAAFELRPYVALGELPSAQVRSTLLAAFGRKDARFPLELAIRQGLEGV